MVTVSVYERRCRRKTPVSSCLPECRPATLSVRLPASHSHRSLPASSRNGPIWRPAIISKLLSVSAGVNGLKRPFLHDTRPAVGVPLLAVSRQSAPAPPRWYRRLRPPRCPRRLRLSPPSSTAHAWAARDDYAARPVEMWLSVGGRLAPSDDRPPHCRVSRLRSKGRAPLVGQGVTPGTD